MSGRVPKSSRGNRRPIKATSEVLRAADLYERFTGHNADEYVRVTVPEPMRTGVAIGDVDGILYTTVRDGRTEKYIHKFRAKDKPLFVVSSDGKQIALIGGRYEFTERGIVDASDKS